VRYSLGYEGTLGSSATTYQGNDFDAIAGLNAVGVIL
jgi:hypothetical protein